MSSTVMHNEHTHHGNAQTAAVVDPHKQVIAERYKTKLCRNWISTGVCPYEVRCMFAHGEHELRTTEMNLRDGLVTEDAIRNFKKMMQLKQQARAIVQETNNFTTQIPTTTPQASSRSQHHHQRQQSSSVSSTASSTPLPPAAFVRPVAVGAGSTTAGFHLQRAARQPVAPSRPYTQIHHAAAYTHDPYGWMFNAECSCEECTTYHRAALRGVANGSPSRSGSLSAADHNLTTTEESDVGSVAEELRTHNARGSVVPRLVESTAACEVSDMDFVAMP